MGDMKRAENDDDADIEEAMCTAFEDVKRQHEKGHQITKEDSSTSMKAKRRWKSLKTKVKKKDYVVVPQMQPDKPTDTPAKTNEEKNYEKELDEIKDMSILLSAQRERKVSRRDGISERNQTERIIVQKTLENLVIIKNIKEMTQHL